MTSMTGYAYKEISNEQANISVEIKSVNSRYLDLSINLPPYLSQLENRLRALVSEKVQRGKVDVFIRVKNFISNETVTADVEAAKSFYAALQKVAHALGKSDDEIPLSLVTAQNGVLIVNQEYDVEKYWASLEPVFIEALDTFIADRKREGENLYKDLLEKLEKLEKCAAFFKEWQPKMEGYFKDLITKKFNELLGSEIDDQRVMTETAAMLVKYTINEEIVRLLSHLSALRNEMANNPFPGKKMDFICQEINREINTIGSKNQFAEVGAMVVTAKDSIENIREQSRNVE
ncbi:MAG: YicC family protein [Treponema sp.]|nr:YicC family protein [Treponema sp.]